MADLSSLSGTTSSSSSTASDLLVQAYKQSQQSRVDALNSKKTALESRRTFFNGLNSKISAILGNVDSFTADNYDSKFFTRKLTSSDTSVLSATGTGDAVLGINNIFVERLASSDILIGQQLSLSASFGESAGTKSFDLLVNGETFSVDVDFDGTETNQQAMTKIVNAINDVEDVEVNASYIKDTSTTGRITITSKTTGGENNISFTDSSVLAKLGITTAALNPGTTSRTVSSGTSAGYRSADYNSLDAKLQVNGIDVVRSSNTIDDLLTGVTLNLLKPQDAGDQAITLTTEVNRKTVEDLINPFLKNYNELITYLSSNSSQQRQDSAVSQLFSRLRNVSSQAVAGLDADAPKYLSEIGIKINSDGTLSISDTDKLQDMLEDDPQKVADLFTSADGFAEKINSVIANMTGDTGLIKSRINSFNQQIQTTVQRTTELEDRIDRQAETLRKEYEDTLLLYLNAQNQLSFISYFSTGF